MGGALRRSADSWPHPHEPRKWRIHTLVPARRSVGPILDERLRTGSTLRLFAEKSICSPHSKLCPLRKILRWWGFGPGNLSENWMLVKIDHHAVV